MTDAPKRPRKIPRAERPIIGWREWMSFPTLGVEHVKAKIDTGARTSAIHAYDIREYLDQGVKCVRFKLHPIQKNSTITVEAKAELLEHRTITSSGGHRTTRPVIITPLTWNDHTWEIELTLTSRDTMGFRMLLGREAVRDRFLVDPGGSHLGGIPEQFRRKKRKRPAENS